MPKKPFQRGQKFRPIFSLGMSHDGHDDGLDIGQDLCGDGDEGVIVNPRTMRLYVTGYWDRL